MLNRRFLRLLAPVLLTAGLVLAGEHDHHDAKSPATATSTPTTKAVNAMCVVETDHPVDDRVWTVYKGQVVGFCCEDCQAEFKKNPDKYVNNLP